MELTSTKALSYALLPAGMLVGTILAVGLTSLAEDTELDTGPRAIPYNGILEFNGEVLNGQADLMFTLTDVPGGEGANCLFEEEHDNVTAYTGRFSVNIGSVTGDLPDCVFDSEAMYIEVGVREATSDGDYVALSGSQRIHPVPFSYWAAEGSDFKIDGDLKVSGAIENPDGDTITLNDKLDVAGEISNTGLDGEGNDIAVVIQDSVEIADNLDVNGSFNITGTIKNPDGNTVTINDKLDITGALFNSEVITVSNFDFAQPLTIDDDLVVNDSLRVNNNFIVDGTATINDGISNSSSNNSGRVYINDGLNIEGGMNVANNTIIGSDGTGNLDVNGDLDVAGKLEIADIEGNGDSGCMRIGSIQQCWGSGVTGTPQTFPVAFRNSNVIVTLTSNTTLPRPALVTSVDAEEFESTSHQANGNNSTGFPFYYFAVGTANTDSVWEGL
ncbi:MAG: hypothetical protein AAFX99_22010 [Myxococcota bacterium]